MMGAENRFGGVGSPNWPGLFKLAEEMNELGQILMKIAAAEGTQHWAGDLEPDLTEEIGDVTASLIYFKKYSLVADQRRRASDRAHEKYERFSYWHRVDQKQRDASDAPTDAGRPHMGDDEGQIEL
jgi:hypothetical protein